jgi:hypothetical protein
LSLLLNNSTQSSTLLLKSYKKRKILRLPKLPLVERVLPLLKRMIRKLPLPKLLLLESRPQVERVLQESSLLMKATSLSQPLVLNHWFYFLITE